MVPASLRNFSTYVFLAKEDWFEVEVDFIRGLATTGFRALDVGANLGFYAVAIARRCGPEGRVWAVEPDPAVASRIRQSAAANRLDNLTVLQLALGERAGSGTLETAYSPEFNVVRPGGAASPERPQIDVVSLDELAATAGIRGVDFVKLDAEGMETAILRGGSRFFATESPLVMAEIHHGNAVQAGLLTEFKSRGYRLWRFAPGLGRLVPLAGDETDFGSLNLFACKDDRAGRLASDDRLIPAPDHAATAAPGAFAEFYRSTEFGRRLLAEMGPMESWLRDPACRPYVAALDLYAASRQETAAPAARYALLLRSYRALEGLCEEQATYSRLLSLARAACDLGLVEQMVRALEFVLGALTRGDVLALPEPFLPLDARFERVPDFVAVPDWVKAMTIDRYFHRKYAASYGHPDCHAAEEQLLALGFGTPEIERSRQLFRIAARLQAGPTASDPLIREPAATLNWDYWRGALPDGEPQH